MKMIISKHFTIPKVRAAWRKLFSPSPRQKLKDKAESLEQVFSNRSLQEYTDIWFSSASKCFSNAVLRRLEKVQCKCFFWHQPEICFSAMLQEYICYNVEWVEVLKISQVFWAKLYCKMSYLFCWFCSLWEFLQRNRKLIDKLQIWVFNLLFSGAFFIFGDCFRAFSQFSFDFFRRRPTMVADIFIQLPNPVSPPPPLPQPFYGTVFNPCLKNDHVFYNNGRKIEKNLDLDTLPL